MCHLVIGASEYINTILKNLQGQLDLLNDEGLNSIKILCSVFGLKNDET